jgi:hypothetical protein
MSSSILPCIFCPNPRTIKRGEHLWDDWLNREDGKDIYDPSTTYYYGADGVLIRSHKSTRLNVALNVVCDRCNNTWMSDISNHAKTILEPSIRRDTPRHFDDLDIVTTTAFAFMKSAVLDWQPNVKRPRRISRPACMAFRASLMPGSKGDIAFPDGLQLWLAKYKRTRKMEAFSYVDELIGKRNLKGYRILVITYLVGSFIFQLTLPRWTKRTRHRAPAPFFQIIGDIESVPIWPGVLSAYWPPIADVNGRTLQVFRERFRTIRVPRVY